MHASVSFQMVLLLYLAKATESPRRKLTIATNFVIFAFLIRGNEILLISTEFRDT